MIRITANTKKATDLLTGMVQKQIPFALSKAVNSVAVDVQKQIQGSLASHFTLRKKGTWLANSIKMLKWSKKQDRPIAAVVGVDPNRNILARFEKAGTKKPTTGQMFAVPIAARPAPARLITKKLGVRALQLRKHLTKSGKVQLKGLERSFLLKLGDRVLIMQRYGKRGLVRVLHAFKRSAPIPERLHFMDTAAKVVPAMWGKRVGEALREAMRTAK